MNDKIHNYVLFDIIVNFIIQSIHFPKKVHKLSKAKFSLFDRRRGDKNKIFRTLVSKKVGGLVIFYGLIRGYMKFINIPKGLQKDFDANVCGCALYM